MGELEEKGLNLLTPNEREKKQRAEAVCREYKENIATVVGHGYKPWRLFRALAEKYGLTPIGVTYILKEAGLYKGSEETIAQYSQA